MTGLSGGGTGHAARKLGPVKDLLHRGAFGVDFSDGAGGGCMVGEFALIELSTPLVTTRTPPQDRVSFPHMSHLFEC